jgi:hypothetical protein
MLFYLAFAFYVFPILASAFIASAVYWGRTPDGLYQHPYIPLVIGCLLLIGSLFIAAEAVLSFIQLSAWGTTYHGFTIGSQTNPARGQSEFSVAFGAILMAYISAVGVTVFSASALNAFTKIDTSGFGELLSTSAYYSLTTMLQVGDADPRNGAGRLVVFLIYLNSAAFVFIVLALVIGNASSAAIDIGAKSAQQTTQPSRSQAGRAVAPVPGQASAVSTNLDRVGSPASGANVKTSGTEHAPPDLEDLCGHRTRYVTLVFAGLSLLIFLWEFLKRKCRP